MVAVEFEDPAATTRIFSPMTGVSSRGGRVDPRVEFQRLGRTPRRYSNWLDSQGIVVQFLRT